jgi:hypothetical protein
MRSIASATAGSYDLHEGRGGGSHPAHLVVRNVLRGAPPTGLGIQTRTTSNPLTWGSILGAAAQTGLDNE